MSSTRHLVTALIATVALMLTVPAFASAAASLEASPTPLVFPDTGIHDPSQTQSTQITNNGDEGASLTGFNATFPFTIDYGASDCDDVGTLEVGKACDLTVRFGPKVVGPVNGDVTIEYSDSGGSLELDIPASGTGVTGTLEASPLNFEPQPYYFGGQQWQANVTNVSSYTVVGGNASISGPDAGAFSVTDSNCNGNFMQPGNGCNIGVQFNPAGPGTYTAELEITNDGAVDPVVVPLTAEALVGPIASVASEFNFGAVEVNSAASSQQLTISDSGDYPLQIQQLLIISGTPHTFPVSNDNCSQRIIKVGDHCEITVGFSPTGAGERNASVFVISNTPGPVTTVSLTGTGMFAPNGSAQLTSQAKVGVPISCLTSGYRDVDTLSYKWLRGGVAVPGEAQYVYVPVEADVGSTLSCEVTAVNPVGTQHITSASSAPVVASSGTPTLFTSFAGSAKRGYALNVLSQDGLNEVRTKLSSHLGIQVARARGFIEIQSAGVVRRFPLRGASTVAGNGVTVKLKKKTIEITSLPPQTTSVNVGLRGDTVHGHGGQIKTTALVGGQAQAATTMSVFTPTL
jgi:hypothetical protein